TEIRAVAPICFQVFDCALVAALQRSNNGCHSSRPRKEVELLLPLSKNKEPVRSSAIYRAVIVRRRPPIANVARSDACPSTFVGAKTYSSTKITVVTRRDKCRP